MALGDIFDETVKKRLLCKTAAFYLLINKVLITVIYTWTGFWRLTAPPTRKPLHCAPTCELARLKIRNRFFVQSQTNLFTFFHKNMF